jgi:hypothetical protein
LFVAAVLFTGWMSYLGYAALTKSHAPTVSHIQFAAARDAVVGEVRSDEDGKPAIQVKVVQWLFQSRQNPAGEVSVLNLSEVKGYDGPGQYLLLLQPEQTLPPRPLQAPEPVSYLVVGQQRSPGNDLGGVGKPLVYRWTDDVRKQFELLDAGRNAVK